MNTAPDRRAEHRFFLAMSLLMAACVLLGFARSFLLRPWFPDHPSPPEAALYRWHGLAMMAWFALLIAQALLAGRGALATHRRLGTAGALLALAMLAGFWMAARLGVQRPGGFTGVPLPPLVFATVPLLGGLLFGGLVAWAVAARHDPATHKRLMLIASGSLVEAAVARWPFAWINAQPLPFIGASELVVLGLFVLPLLVFDRFHSGRVHAATRWAGLALLILLLLRIPLGFTPAWQGFARWLLLA